MGKPSKRRVGLYSRVSLEDQDPEVQLHELRQHAERRGWHVVAEYVDHGVSGAKTSRPALDRLLADARRGKLDLIATWSICRFGRSLSHLVLTIEELTRLGVAYCAVTQGIDTSDDNPAATLTLQVLGACSQFERAIIRSRVRAGLAKAKATGRRT
jgi:DNA invertase Pin-like site-specific DNA recombinase